MDLDPMKRRLITRILAALDTILGLCVFIIQIHRMWEYYYDHVIRHRTQEAKPDEKESTLSFTTFVCISIIILSTKVMQICMGFGLLVATFGRNLEASIRISTWWLRTSIFIFVTLIFKLSFMITLLVDVITQLVGTSGFDFGTLVFGMIFRIFSTYWVTRFIIFLQWQAEFESYCSHRV